MIAGTAREDTNAAKRPKASAFWWIRKKTEKHEILSSGHYSADDQTSVTSARLYK